MEADPLVAAWAARAQTDVIEDREEIRYYADLGRVMFRQVRSDLGIRLVEAPDGRQRVLVSFIDAADGADVARFLIMRFASSWLRGELKVRVPLGRFVDVPPAPLRIEKTDAGDRAVRADGSVRAVFRASSTRCGPAWAFMQYADMPIEAMSRRLEVACSDAAARERAGKRSGRLARLECRAGIARQICRDHVGVVRKDVVMDDTAGHDDDRELVLMVDRLGTVLGASLNVMPDGVAAPFETRSMPPEAQGGPYGRYVMRNELPPGWTIRSTTVAPSSAMGSTGGAVELQVVDGLGRWVSTADLLKLGVL